MSNKVYILQFKQVKWLLIISYLIAFIIDNALHISFNINLFPSIILLVLIFWVVQLTASNHYFTAFIIGIFTDISMNTMLGVHSLMFIIIVFLMLRVRRGFNNYPTWQKTMIVVFYLFLVQIFSWFILQPNLVEEFAYYYWLSPLLAILIWPILYKIMSFLTDRTVFN